MDDFMERVARRVRKEIRYARGMLVMYRERNEEYYKDLHISLSQADYRRAREIAQDLAAFQREARRVRARLHSAMEREWTLATGGAFRGGRDDADRMGGAHTGGTATPAYGWRAGDPPAV
jgi:hypothetical protein